MERICIYSKDVRRITGHSERTAQKILKELRRHYGKEKHHYITKHELAKFLGIPPDDIILD
jgi:hypothetical protein